MDMDDPVPVDKGRQGALRQRTSSMRSYPSNARAESPRLHIFPNRTGTLVSQNPRLTPDRPHIHAPRPTRHLLDSPNSLLMRTPSLSPVSSRAASPPSPPAISVLSADRFLRKNASLGTIAEAFAASSTAAPNSSTETSMARRCLRWLHKRGLKQHTIPLAILCSILLKLSIAMGSYSGQGTPPMYGDYEAQRHWMELTIHLPPHEWYRYDLQYWGLDYPPLTAYVSWLCGFVAHHINSSWVALDASRGIETAESKLFMRFTVLVLDTLIYVPALVMFTRTWLANRSRRTQHAALLLLLTQPALLLIDFGHFQYNSVMLGLTLLALNFFAIGRDTLGAAFFVISLGFKQMALYYAPVVGTYLLSKCIHVGGRDGRILFARLALVTSTTFALLFLPWLSPPTLLLDPLTRIFPFGRGLFEDKVANFWCATNVVVKWRRWANAPALIRLSTALTALGFLPAVGILLRGAWILASARATEERESSAADTAANPEAKPDTAKKTKTSGQPPLPLLPLLPYALLTSSLSFFLFSFQVHEKTILVPLLPITMLMASASPDSALFGWGALVNNVAMFSMWPLLRRDGLGVQYIALLLLWNRLIGYNPVRLPAWSFVQVLSVLVYAAAFALHILELAFAPPARFPDLYPVLNVLVSTPVFAAAWLWSIVSMLRARDPRTLGCQASAAAAACEADMGEGGRWTGRRSDSVTSSSTIAPQACGRRATARCDRHTGVRELAGTSSVERRSGGRSQSLTFSHGRTARGSSSSVGVGLRE
ncbi:ALG6, ALG8 glycosyltransferase family-domain-containing protein [Schizophyllum amplum]|uniref:Alpha-1,3-glucosyltransferase n=1 Tax=Schizophyllum amplum TaxID=97359 RepID=A0A550CGY7_9AGAR|nr:ALG6, ALG8 glycosyltransferase family-domain-containing protein [Auriculariopsis ampla]